MSHDISGLLKDWDYDPAHVSARWIQGHDGRPKVQLRLDLGLFQMEVAGRPDGTLPQGCASLLDYYLGQEQSAPEDWRLDAAACTELQQEAMQYYYRYLAFYALHHLEGVIEDAAHNLSLIDLVSEYAENDDLAWQFLQFFPYVRIMHARASSEKAVQLKQFDAAVKILEDALEDIREFWGEFSESESATQHHELDLLDQMLQKVKSRRPKSRQDTLHEELDLAIQLENYEKAAFLRDELKRLKPRRSDPPAPSSNRNSAG